MQLVSIISPWRADIVAGAGFGNEYISPTIYYKFCNTNHKDAESEVHSIKIGEGIPFRTLSYSQNILNVPKDVYFYDGIDKLPIRTQETILRDSAFPSKNITPSNFWGLSIPK